MTIASFCRDLLICGPLPVDLLAARAAEAGVTTARDPAVAVRSALTYKEVLLADGRWATPLWLLEGRILTVRALPFADVWPDDDCCTGDPGVPDGSRHDLALLEAAARSCSVPLADGGFLRRSSYGSGLRAPKGWPTLRPGRSQVLGLRVREGALHVELVPADEALHRAGDRLAHELGPLDSPGRYWSTTDCLVSERLVAALWERMAADPDFLTSPVPPFSQCIPPLAAALEREAERRSLARRRWQPQLDLPAELQSVALEESARSGQLVDGWLSTFVTRRLRDLDNERASSLDERAWPDADGEVVPLQSRRWQ